MQDEKTITDVAVVEPLGPPAVKLTDESIAVIEHNMRMAEKLVYSVLEKDVDYGTLPGVQGLMLFEPGADKVLNAFNCYAEPIVLSHKEGDGLVSFLFKADTIQRDTGLILSSGIGAASTKETKYKYRWVFDPENYGLLPEEINKLKKKTEGKSTKYRIPNPEYEDLVNTLAKIGFKRAKCDSAQGLPGVSSAIRKLQLGLQPNAQATRKLPDWNVFWGKVATLGISEQEVHDLLGVTSVTEWVKQGKTLEEAIDTLARSLAQRHQPASPNKAEATKATAPKNSDALFDVNENDIPDLNALLKVAYQRWGLQPAEVWSNLGYLSQKDCQMPPWEAYQTLKYIQEPPE